MPPNPALAALHRAQAIMATVNETTARPRALGTALAALAAPPACLPKTKD